MNQWQQDLLRDLGVFAIGVTAIVSAAGWAFRQWVKLQHAQTIERLRADLELAATEHGVRFRHLHAKVAETVDETYARLWRFYSAVGSYVKEIEYAGEPSKEEKLEIVSQAGEEFRLYFLPRRIYFEQAMAVRIMAFVDELIKSARDCKRAQEARHTGEGSTLEPWVEAVKRMKTIAEPLFQELGEHFRELIGIKTAKQDNKQDGRKGGE